MFTTTTKPTPAPAPRCPSPPTSSNPSSSPLALDAFFAKPTITNYDIPSLRNQDAPNLIHQQAQTALLLLERMRPQGQKPVRLRPRWA
jgi:hypothetical protein